MISKIKILTASSALALCVAYYYQYVLNYMPCYLCMIERIPHIIIVIVCLLCLYINRNNCTKLCYPLLMLVLASNVVLSSYHVAIEQGIIKESTVCTSNKKTTLQKGLKPALLLEYSYPVCSKANLFIFSVSLTTWHLLYCTFVFFATLCSKFYLSKLFATTNVDHQK